MKHSIIILVLIVILCSCGHDRQIPCFDSYPITLSGNLTYGGNICALRAVIHDCDTADITVESPETLAGYSFKVDNSSVWVYYDNMQIELKADAFDIPCFLITEMLALSPENFEYSRKESDTTVYYYAKDDCDIALFIKEDSNAPFRIDYMGEGCELRLDIDTFTIQ